MGQAPVKPKSPVGEMLAYYYESEPALFASAIETQLGRLRDERNEQEKQQAAAAEEKKQNASVTSSVDVTLYRCSALQWFLFALRR